MKKVLSIVLAFCFIFVGFVFTGCGETPDISLSGTPAYEDYIYGNGSLAVTKGDYVYFASGYVKEDDLGQGKKYSNIKGTVANGALYRAKVVQTTTGEGEESVISNSLTEVQLMVSKIVGFEKGGIYIFKDKIYFASPSIVKDGTGTRYDLITFYSCNLDGSNLQEFYQKQKLEIIQLTQWQW